MDSESSKLEMFFFPFVGGGHLIPMIDLARLFASHGVKATILAIPNDAVVFHKVINRDKSSGHDIHLHTLQPPPGEQLTTISSVDMSAPPFTDTSILQEPLKQLLLRCRPDCLVTDTFHRWIPDVVDAIGVPRVIFNGNCCFARVCEDIIKKHEPHLKVGSDSEPFVLEGLPDRIELTSSQLPIFTRRGTEFPGKSMRADQNSFAQVINSFYELEPAYVDYFRNVMGKKAYLIGPVSLCNRNVADKAERGQNSAIDEQSCLKWLDSKTPNSVIYVSFGSLVRLKPTQLHEIAYGLESSDHSFIWVIGKIMESNEKSDKNWLPDAFEQRMMETQKGLIIKGWAPQLLILEHEAVGGFMTHCGWNSTLECVCAGVPMVTWPLSADQFYNEKLVTEVLRIGVRVGSLEWASWNMERKEVVGREKVEAAVRRLMGGGETPEMRRRAKELAEKARRAVEEGGSSYNDAVALIEELKTRRKEGLDSAGDSH
ncbi:abscisate beta-glucosyltransferase-like [Cornus florida]|uniref:abscisate beta-glucosyltransferase-like n=1 Tax=Cornus florida TaxID=4283 RepID=UPI0028A121E8|nr:abscisate beta-glucosyltransferase-like [Cornus florida]